MSDSGPIHFSLVVLCYRSGRSVIPLIEQLHHMLSLFYFRWEIILVGNFVEGSDDETPQVVTELSTRFPEISAVVLPKQGMMGWDMRTGLNAAKGEYLGVIDGDGQFPLESIVACLLKIESEHLDFVKTYRVSREDGLFRWAISKIYNFIFRILFHTHLRDINSKPKILKKAVFDRMALKSDDWFVDAEIILRALELGLKVGEIPVHFCANSERRSFVKLGAILEFSRNLWNYRFKRGVHSVTRQA